MKAIVFDLDGTLIHSAPDLHAACNRMLADAGKPPQSLETVTGYIGNGVAKLVERAMATAGIPASEHARMVEIFMRHYDADPATLTRPYPGLIPLLERLKARGHALAICTNKPEAPAREILRLLEMEDYFSALVGGDTLEVRKPDPAPLHHCLELLGAPEAIYVGDSETDAETARRAALPFALFTGGYRKKPLSELPHDFAFADFADLGPWIEGRSP